MQKAIRCFHMAADDGNSYAEYQLGKIFYFGNGIRADREKGLDYLAQSAAHGNVYAENLLRVIRQQHIRGASSLIAQLGRMFQEKEQRQDRVRLLTLPYCTLSYHTHSERRQQTMSVQR